MPTNDDAPHANWAEADADEHVHQKYDPRPVTRFDRVSDDARSPSLWLRPVDPNTEHAETERYGVSVVREGEEGNEPFAHTEGFEAARRVAKAFVEAYERAVDGGSDSPIEAGKEAARSADDAVSAPV
ncbi:hypothetical protein [Halogeometricum limi]|uniref:Uncharacterized protein n=1 Tax=Halogeometricum limi TaxID=555875 RepID=A0A1I6HKK9_9EURY|nr:hypothetical protein [Halogeometricum limi]SFR54982.1 hypothetical protein SAMN04488124_2345 [Halogeometricum limi]